MIVTEEFLKMHASPVGKDGRQFSWKRAHIEALGLSYPHKKGWMELIIGKEITEEQANKYIQVNNGVVNKVVVATARTKSSLEYRWMDMLDCIKKLGGEEMAEDFLKEIFEMYAYEKKENEKDN